MRPLTAQLPDPALCQARQFYAARANAFVRVQTARLRVERATILLGVKKGIFAERIAELSPIAFAAEMSGRNTITTNKHARQFRD